MQTCRSALVMLSAVFSVEAASLTGAASDSSRTRQTDSQYRTGHIRTTQGSSKPLLAIGVPGTPTKSSADSSSLLADSDLDPSSTRGLVLPNAFMLRKGQGEFVQSELVFSQFGFGVTDHFNVSAGSALPFIALYRIANLVLGAKLGGSIGGVHAALGWTEMMIKAQGMGPGNAFGCPYGSIGFANRIGNGSLTYWHTAGSSDGPASLLSVSGLVRPVPHAAFLFELWRIQLPDESPMLWSAPGVRVMSGGLSGDLALVLTDGTKNAFPWVNIAYAF